MKRLALCLVVLFTLGLVPLARAAELISPPLLAIGQERLTCKIVNLSTRPRAVRIQIFRAGGFTASQGLEIELPPNAAIDHSVTGSVLGGVSGYCRFIVQGSKKLYRAVATVKGSLPEEGDRAAVPAE